MQSLAHQFLTFCRSKPADEEYNYCSPAGCAFAQFLEHAGFAKEPGVDSTEWCDMSLPKPVEHPLPAHVDKCVIALPETFGALADRLEAALSEKVAS